MGLTQYTEHHSCLDQQTLVLLILNPLCLNSLILSIMTTECSHSDQKLCLPYSDLSLLLLLLNSFLSFPNFQCFLWMNSISPPLTLWIKPSKFCNPIFSFLKTFHSHFCCNSKKILIILVIHWTACSLSHNNRNNLSFKAEFSSWKSNMLASYTILSIFPLLL